MDASLPSGQSGAAAGRGHWDFRALVDEPLDALRARYGIAPLDRADAALDDDQVDRTLLVRTSQPLPVLGTAKVAERPTSSGP